MTELETWLNQATRRLSNESAARVRSEIEEHYRSTREAALLGGANAGEADRFAIAALGDAKAANRQYREVLLTAAEARVLREANWEGRAFCSRRWLKWLLLAIPVAAILAATVLFRTGVETGIAQVLLVGGIGMGFMFASPFLPIYTPLRSRIFRPVKWVVLIGMVWLPFGPDAIKWWWLVLSCLWPMASIEWTRVSIRRKLPVAEWPKALYR